VVGRIITRVYNNNNILTDMGGTTISMILLKQEKTSANKPAYGFEYKHEKRK